MTASEGMRVYRFEEPVAESLGPRTPKSRRRPPWKAAFGILIALGLVAGAIAWLGRPTDGRIVDGTRIDGVDVGGMTPAEAKSTVRAHGESVVARGLVLVADGNRFTIDTDAIDLRPNAGAAVKKALGEPAFVERVRMRVGLTDPVDIPLTFLFRRKPYMKATLPMRQAVTIAPRSASVTADGRRFPVTPAEDGRVPNMVALGTAVRTLSRSGPDIEVPVKAVEPAISTDQATEQAVRARTFVSTRHRVDLKGDVNRVPQDVIRRSAGFVVGKRTISFRISQGPLRAWFSSLYGKREKAPRNARFTVTKDGNARIIAGRNGRGVDVGSLVAAWQVDPGQRLTPITFGPREPALTTDEARNLGVKEVVGEFFTPYSGGARVTNIKLAASILDQRIIPAGATFSLNEALGQRTAARGFVEAPMIGEGNRLEDAYGGGVSQVATTVFNAAFFSGLKLIAHTPHSFWIPRYPKGREATVSWGGPELIFQNDWKAPIVILTKTTEEGITVRFLSDRLGRKVEVIEGEPYSFSKARVIRERDPSLEPGTRKTVQPMGEPGFWIKYGRRVYKGGELRSQQSWTWRYFPENKIILIGPKKRPEPVPEDPAVDGEAGDGGAADGGAGEPAAEAVPEGAT
ncbi:MAG: VanW family protein [Gaiellales bacterium]